MTQYRIRPSVAIASSAAVPLIACLAVAIVVRPSASALLAAGLVATTLTAYSVRRVRRRTLTVSADGLVVQRDKYRLVVPWTAVRTVQRRRHQLFLHVEELVCAEGRLEAFDSRGRPSELPEALVDHPALSRVMVSLYAKDWRQGPIGENLAHLGIDS